MPDHTISENWFLSFSCAVSTAKKDVCTKFSWGCIFFQVDDSQAGFSLQISHEFVGTLQLTAAESFPTLLLSIFPNPSALNYSDSSMSCLAKICLVLYRCSRWQKCATNCRHQRFKWKFWFWSCDMFACSCKCFNKKHTSCSCLDFKDFGSGVWGA